MIGGAILLTAVGGWFTTYQTASRAAERAAEVARVREVIGAIHDASSAVYRAEAAHRNYLIEGSDERRAREVATAGAADRALAQLRGLADDRVRARLDAMAPSLEQRNIPDIERQFDEMRRDARQHLAMESGLERSARVTAFVVLLVSALGTLLILGLVALRFNYYVNRREADEERLRSALEAAAAANAAKTQFLATVSHEIRTPLNAVSGMSELLLETPLDSEQTEFARSVYTNAEALSMLIGDLLDSSRIEAGQVFLESAPFDLLDLVEGVGEMLVVRAEVKGIELIVDVPPDGPRRLVGDRTRLRQILVNLVGNAVKFTERGQVTIRAWAEPCADGGSAVLHVSVIDSGIGIAPEAQLRIFERFVQADRSTSHRFGGTGLGLSISRSLVELMGGTLSVQSELDRGSVFDVLVTLPLAPTQPAAEIDRASLAGVSVLVIQPNPLLRDTIVRLLEYAGASVRAVATAAEGFAEDSQAGARVIVVGERLPDSTGLEFARQSWRAQDGAAAPGKAVVLLCSLRAMAAGYIGSYGIAACVYKPVKQVRLIQAVRRAAGLEATTAEPADEASAVIAPSRAVAPRVLIVEDNHDNWRLAARVLGDAGYEVDRAEDGVQGVAAAAAFTYDLILMDVDLPGLDGLEAVRRIRAQQHGSGRARVPVLALTAHAVDTMRQQALAAGMDDYLTKPIQKEDLLEACRRWIDARPCLLVVDDAPEIHVLIANYFRGSDYRIVDTYNGQEAIDAFAQQRISLVLVDVNMPIKNGPETVRELRGLRRGEGVPIVALTGDDPAAQASMMERCDASLSKPVRRADLLATVAGLIGRPASWRRPPRDGSSPLVAPTQGEAPSPHTLARAASAQALRLIALRDFTGLIAFGEHVRAMAGVSGLSKLVTVGEELIDAAQSEDVQRAEHWANDLAPTIHEMRPELVGDHVSPRGGPYDALARVAMASVGVPAVALSVVHGDQVQIKGGAGLPPATDAFRELPLTRSFTQFVMEQGAPLVMEDVRTQERLRDAIPVAAHSVVAAAVVPIRNREGATIGTIAALDRRPHRWPSEEIALLEDLAHVATQLLEAESLLARSDQPGHAEAVVVEDDIADLVPGYVEEQRKAVATLQAMLSDGDFDGIRKHGHRMKGSGAGYGLADVSRVGAALQEAADRGDGDALRHLLAELQVYLATLTIRSADGRTVVRS